MVTNILLVIAAICALVYGMPPEVEELMNDYVIRSSHNRLSGWNVLGPNKNKCDMVRKNIKKFGYCWKDKNDEKGINTQKERGWVREVIQQWEKCGGMKFVEEPKCRNGSDFVRIRVGNYGPMLEPYMDESTCNIYGFDMFLSFYTFGENIDGYKRTEKIRESNIKMYALHEFGHFLGFDHEHNRNDKGKCIYDIDSTLVGPDAVYGNYHITKEYDLESIMNYCRPNVHYKPWLSSIDKKGVWATYGGGDWNECEAVTKPWKWYPGDGLYDHTLAEMEKEGGYGANANATSAPTGCVDLATRQECDERKANCFTDSMKYWCRKTCKHCQ